VKPPRLEEGREVRAPILHKKNRDEVVGLFIQEKVWLKNSLNQSEGG